ncbi:MAG: type II secretion system F family protein [Verrucomicrobiota bacterium]
MDPIFIIFCLLVVGAAALFIIGSKPKEAPSIGKRLEGLRQQEQSGTRSLRDEEEMNKSFIVRVVLPMAEKMSGLFKGITPQGSLEKCRKDIIAAGWAGKVSPLQITSLSWFLLIVLPTFFFLMASMTPPVTNKEWLIVFITMVLGYRLPFGIVQGKAKRRAYEIQKALPFTLDLVSISVEAGMALDGAIAIVAEKTRGPLTDELNQTLREIRLGKSRAEALADLGERTRVDDLKQFLTAVNYISKLGGSLVDVIRIQAQAMRIKRRQRAEEKAMKTPVKIMIPLVLFIFPSMFIVILGPAFIQLMENSAKAPV